MACCGTGRIMLDFLLSAKCEEEGYAIYHKKLFASRGFGIDLCRRVRLACVCGGDNFNSPVVGHMGTLVQSRTAVVWPRSGCQQASEAGWEHHPQRGWRFHESDLEAARCRARKEEWRPGAKRHCYPQSPQPMSAGTDTVRIEHSTRHRDHTAEGRSRSDLPFGPAGAPRAYERAAFRSSDAHLAGRVRRPL